MEYTLLIRDIREKRGMTQTELAKKSKVTQPYISQLENNSPKAKSPTLRIMFRIAQALDTCPHFLVQYNMDCDKNCFNICDQKIF